IVILSTAILTGTAAAFYLDVSSRCAAEEWSMDEIVLEQGRTLRGMIESESLTQIDFVEVHRPPGKPMYLVVHPIKIDDKTFITRLSDAERALLAKKIEAFRSRARIEASRRELIPVETLEQDGL